MNQLKSIRNGIRELEDAKRLIDNQIRELHKTYSEMRDLLSKPEYTDGSRYLDMKHPYKDELAEYVPLASYDPLSERWVAIVEWEINKGRGASAPYVLDSYDTTEEAFDAANANAELLSLNSKTK